MRKFIYKFILENLDIDEEKAKSISENLEQKIVDNYWIKDKRKDVNHKLNKTG